jgi:hypothetical protein
VSRWFDLSAFANPGFRLWPNGGRNVIIGPGTKQIDFSLFKNMRLGEGQKSNLLKRRRRTGLHTLTLPTLLRHDR